MGNKQMKNSEYNANKHGFTFAPTNKPIKYKKQGLRLITVLKCMIVFIVACVLLALIK